MKKIKVEVRNVYGNELVYPACDTSKLLCKLTGKKTFDHASLRIIEALGYSIIH